MDGKETIIERIILDANSVADEILGKAKERASNTIDEAKEWADAYLEAQNKLLETDLANIISRKNTVADLDVKKVNLSAKQKVLENVFDLVLEKLCALDKKSMQKLISSLLVENAEDGDRILISSKANLSSEDLASLEIYQSKNLSVIGNDGDFVGGIYLINDKCDKDLSFETLTKLKREEIEEQIAEKLFKE